MLVAHIIKIFIIWSLYSGGHAVLYGIFSFGLKQLCIGQAFFLGLLLLHLHQMHWITLNFSGFLLNGKISLKLHAYCLRPRI